MRCSLAPCSVIMRTSDEAGYSGMNRNLPNGMPAVWNVNSCHLILVQASWGNSDLMFRDREVVVMYPHVGCSKGKKETSVDAF